MQWLFSVDLYILELISSYDSYRDGDIVLHILILVDFIIMYRHAVVVIASCRFYLPHH